MSLLPSDRLAERVVVEERGRAAALEGARGLRAHGEHLRHALHAPHQEDVLQHAAQHRALERRLPHSWENY